MLGNDKGYESHIRYCINYSKIIWTDVICFLILFWYGMVAFFIEKKLYIYSMIFIMLYLLFFLYIIQKSVRIFMFYRFGKIEIDFGQNILVYRDYAKKVRIEFSLDRVILQCFFLRWSDYLEKEYNMEQREVQLSEYGLVDRYAYCMWDRVEYIYYLNDYMIDLEDMSRNDKALFLDYMKKGGKYKEI